jgi:hypothetical protein
MGAFLYNHKITSHLLLLFSVVTDKKRVRIQANSQPTFNIRDKERNKHILKNFARRKRENGFECEYASRQCKST